MGWKWTKSSAFGPWALLASATLLAASMPSTGEAHVAKREISSCKLADINWNSESQSIQCTNEENGMDEPCQSQENWPEQTVAETRCNDFWRSQSNPDSKVKSICLNGKWEEEPTDKNLKCEVICGIAGESAFDSLHVRSRSELANQRKRSPLLKGNWPWHVGIYTEDIPGSGDFRYSCGGTLISTRAILTAAQCVTYRQQPSLELQPSMVKIATGSFKLLYGDRNNDTIETVEKIVLNPLYNHTVYGADLAVVWLHDRVSISPYVHPICLPREDLDEEDIRLNELGKLVVLRNRTFEETHIPTMDLQKCKESSTTHSLLAHSTSFCTRSNNDPSVCTHTAGVGIAFENRRDRTEPSRVVTRWTIQGVRSGVLNLNQDCSKPIIFTKVSKFVQWINNELKNREPPIYPKIIAAASATTVTIDTSISTSTSASSTLSTPTSKTFVLTKSPPNNDADNPGSVKPKTTQTPRPRPGGPPTLHKSNESKNVLKQQHTTSTITSSISRTQNSSLNRPPGNRGSSSSTISSVFNDEDGVGTGNVRSTSKRPIQNSIVPMHQKVEENPNRSDRYRDQDQDPDQQSFPQFNGFSIDGNNNNNNNLKYRQRNNSHSQSSLPVPSISNSRPTDQQFSPSRKPPPATVTTAFPRLIKNRDETDELHGTQLEDWEAGVGTGESQAMSRTRTRTRSTSTSTSKPNRDFIGSDIIEEVVDDDFSRSPNVKQQQRHRSKSQNPGSTTVIIETFPNTQQGQGGNNNDNPENIRWPLNQDDDDDGEPDGVGVGVGSITVTVKERNHGRPLHCPPIRVSEGVKLQCHHERFEDPDNCREGGWPGSRASYTCDKFYKSVYGTISVQQNCTERGSWFPSRDFGCKIECGISSRPKISYIVHGVISDRVSWPWHATIFKRNAVSKRLEYHCGATLIGMSVLITAAHCVTYPRTTNIINEEFVVLLAAISSNFTMNRFDPHTRKYKVKKIFLPDTYNPLTFESDIALIQFEEDVKLTDYTKPICWPSKNNIEYSNLESVHLEHGSRGYTVGFGIDETGELGYELKETALPYVTHKDCRAALDRLPTSTQFCAGYRNGTGTAVCNGDSGGGIYFLDDSNTAKRFILQGIISNGDPKENSKFCNSNNYAVFTKVSSFSSWIEPILDIIGEERRISQTESESEI